MSKLCTICKSGCADAVDSAFAAGSSIRKAAEATGFTFAQVRAHRTHSPALVQQADKTSAIQSDNEVSRQYERLKTMLDEARSNRPDDYGLHLKIESELQKSLRLQATLTDKNPANSLYTEKAVINAQIRALTNEIVSAVADMPQAKDAILNAIKRRRENGAESSCMTTNQIR